MSKGRTVYKLEDLSPKVLVDNETKKHLFLKSENFLKTDWIEINQPWELILELEIETYYILFEYIVYKGKRKIFKGETAIVSKETAAFFARSIMEEELERPIRIMAKDDHREFLLRLDDTSTCYLYT